MAGNIPANDLRRQSSLLIDSRCNFPDSLLDADDIRFIQHVVRDGDIGAMAALNAGLPMKPYMLDSLLSIRVKHRYSKVRLILEPILQFIVRAAHLHNGRYILRDGLSKKSQMFTATDTTRLESGLRRLYHALGMPDNPFDILEAIDNMDLPNIAYERYLKHIYNIISLLEPNVRDRLDYTHLTVFNYIYDPPKFTTQEAINVYAKNLSNITKKIPHRIETLTVTHRSRDPIHVINDLLFCLSFGNYLVSHQDSLRTLKKSMLLSLNNLCGMLYITYTQIPETKSLFQDIARESHVLITSTSEGTPDFSHIAKYMLRFVRAAITADVYTVPEYLSNQIFAITSRLHDVEGAAVGHSDDLDVEIDEDSEYAIAYHVTNPYVDANIFKCPRDVISYIGSMITKKLYREIITEYDEDTLTSNIYEMDLTNDLIQEGAARALRISHEQLSSYLSGSHPPSEVLQESENLFADTTPVTSTQTRDSSQGLRYADIRGAKPYSVTNFQ
nr:tegument protein UL35 [Mastomys natalensis cytomegalovirus 3]WEG69867.1 tegument protein UL35 [Mastomys natalensis cytomegalovirus 3]WEG70007.1 tegument protein UL35 [Mastomys natalensis cytomegalovirus 3]WEG70147.1 tegument protein UL35 [Mastomys natalensis cytomegalovirus 3]WEG70287.1 tegument protein UL35 [Mastomys natalensis cytomegalovirus 3]